MSANVETMFYTRVAPWHGLGICVQETLSSVDALEQSGLDWNVIQRPIMTSAYTPIRRFIRNTHPNHTVAAFRLRRRDEMSDLLCGLQVSVCKHCDGHDLRTFHIGGDKVAVTADKHINIG